MLRCRKFLISVICLSIFASTISSYAEGEIEDLIDIAESTAFTEINLRKSESLEKIKLTYSKATIRTSDRLLTFEASGLPWKELRF
jgi:F420-0:gamma-glutamyl ligase